jgi:hypothetical protein
MRPIIKANIAGFIGAIVLLSLFGLLFGYVWLLTYHKAITALVSVVLIALGCGWFGGMMWYVSKHREDF